MYSDERSSEDRMGDGNNKSPSEKSFDGPVEPEGFIDTDWHEVLDNFDDMNLNDNLLRGIYAYGFEKPSAIQQRAIIPCVKGHDVIAQAQFGTGKTATFAISILQQIDPARRDCQALIIAPTRDLVLQITKVITTLGDFMNIECHAIIGGINLPDDIRKIEMGVHIVIGTPGRVYNMLTSRALRPDTIKLFVLDKTDKLLWRGPLLGNKPIPVSFIGVLQMNDNPEATQVLYPEVKEKMIQQQRRIQEDLEMKLDTEIFFLDIATTRLAKRLEL